MGRKMKNRETQSRKLATIEKFSQDKTTSHKWMCVEKKFQMERQLESENKH